MMNNQVNRKSAVGVVVSDKMEQTVVVKVERLVQHKVYKKYIRRTTKLHVHNPKNQAKLGDTVKIEETRPISKMKSWALVEVLSNQE
jgi:small subunit ribosomal protein S17